MPTNVVDVKENSSAARPRKANECLAEAKRLKAPAELFDEFWREGEVALFFGASGIGKSLLAVQVADALARGTPLHGFVMPKNRRKVLYVDLSLSDPQFQARYTERGHSCPHEPEGRTGVAAKSAYSNAEAASVRTRASAFPYKFAENLYRESPPDGADLCDWIKRMSEENSFRVVIVDDLSAIKRTHDGIRETLACMRRLKKVRDKLGISILVLSDAFEPPDRPVSENDLKRSRVLCTVADSVFALGRKRRPEGGRYIVQTRSRSAEVFWNMQNAPVGEIKRLNSGLLGFEFDERFTPEMDEDKRRMICGISRLHKVEGKTFREIGRQLGISKSWACELYQKWTPAMDNARDDESDDEQDDSNELYKEAYRGEHTDQYLTSIGRRPAWKEKWEAERALSAECGMRSAELENAEHVSEPPAPLLPEEGWPPLWADGVVGAADGCGADSSNYEEPTENHDSSFRDPHSALHISLDAYGREILVEFEDANGKPMIWYHDDKKGNKLRHERKLFGVHTERVNSLPSP